MNHFEYVTTLISFVVAFGVSRLLAGWVHQFNHRSEIEVYPLQVAAACLMLVTLLQSVWATFALSDVVWTFGNFLLLVMAHLALVGAAALVQPPPEHRASARDRYFDMRHAVFGLCAAWVILGGMMEVWLSFNPAGLRVDAAPLRVVLTIRGVALAPFAFLAWSDRPSHHWAGLSVLALLEATWVATVSNSPAA